MGVRPSIVVVGAGAGGISAAFWAQRSGMDVRVLEAAGEVGGRCRTVEQDGFRFDISAGALPGTYTAVLRMVEALGLSPQVERRGAVIGCLRDGAVHRISRRNPLTAITARHLSARDKVSLWRLGLDLARMWRWISYTDLSTAGRFDTMTVSDYCHAHYSPAVGSDLLAAVTRALLLVEPEQTSVVDLFAACKSLLVPHSLLAHPDGIDFFLRRAAEDLDITLGARVESVRDLGDGVEITWADAAGQHVTRADAAVLTGSAPDVLAVHPGLDDVRRGYLSMLDYSACTMVQLGVRRAPSEPSSMVLVPRDIDPDLCVIGLGHNLGPGRAPAGGGVLTAFWMTEWSRANGHRSDADLVTETIGRINTLRPGWADGVVTSVVSRWDPAVVASRVGTFSGLAPSMVVTSPRERIQLAGDWLAQSSVNSSVAVGEQAAHRLRDVLLLSPARSVSARP